MLHFLNFRIDSLKIEFKTADLLEMRFLYMPITVLSRPKSQPRW